MASGLALVGAGRPPGAPRRITAARKAGTSRICKKRRKLKRRIGCEILMRGLESCCMCLCFLTVTLLAFVVIHGACILSHWFESSVVVVTGLCLTAFIGILQYVRRKRAFKKYLSEHLPTWQHHRGGAHTETALLTGLVDLLETQNDESELLKALKALVNRFSNKPAGSVPDNQWQTVSRKRRGKGKGGTTGTTGNNGSTDVRNSPVDNSRKVFLAPDKGLTKGKGKTLQPKVDTRQANKSKPAQQHNAHAQPLPWSKGIGKANNGVSKTPAATAPWKIRSSDWGGAPICHDLDSYLKQRDSESKCKIVLQPLNGSTLAEVLEFLEDTTDTVLSVVFHAGIAPPNFQSNLFKKEVTPGIQGTQIMFRQVWVRSTGSDAPKRPDIRKVDSLKPVSAKTVVLRLYSEQCYNDPSKCSWPSLVKNAGLHARQWSSCVASPRTLQDSWGWAEIASGHNNKTSAVRGLLRVHLNTAASLLTASGRDFNGQRWFVEIAAKDPADSLGGKFDKTEVTWQEVEHRETYAAYVERVRQLSLDMGVIRGFRQLGVRRPATAAEQATDRQVRRLWKSSRAPRSWEFEQMEFLAEQAGLKDIEFLEKAPQRGGSIWRFRATGPQSLDNFAAADGDDTVTITRQDTKRTQHGTPLPSESRARFGQGNLKLQNRFGPSHPGSEGQAASPEAQHGSQDIRMTNGKSAPNSDGGSVPKKLKTSAELIPGLELKENIGAGNCLFHALSDCLQFWGKDCHHLHLRASCVKHLRKHSTPRGSKSSI